MIHEPASINLKTSLLLLLHQINDLKTSQPRKWPHKVDQGQDQFFHNKNSIKSYKYFLKLNVSLKYFTLQIDQLIF